MSTQIKRLIQANEAFVPITLAEAVVVNTDNIALLGNSGAKMGITTLDKVLRTTLGIVGDAAESLVALDAEVDKINTELSKKQDKLTAGAGIHISSDGVISTTYSYELYKVVDSLPTASAQCVNTIYLVPTAGTGGYRDVLEEYICIEKSGSYSWERFGTIQAETDLSNYVTKTELNAVIAEVNKLKDDMAITITAEDVTKSDGKTVVSVTYDIPPTLYD